VSEYDEAMLEGDIERTRIYHEEQHEHRWVTERTPDGEQTGQYICQVCDRNASEPQP